MELWQLDVMGGVRLDDGGELKAVTAIDDHSRFCLAVGLLERATSRPVCGVFAAILLFWHLFVGGEGVAEFPTLERVVRDGFGDLLVVHAGERMPRLFSYAIASVFRVTWGFLLATAVAIPLGLVMGWYGRVFWALNPLVQIMPACTIGYRIASNLQMRLVFMGKES